MRVAENLHMSIEQVMQLSVLELQLWFEWFKMQQETMNSGNTNNRHKGRR